MRSTVAHIVRRRPILSRKQGVDATIPGAPLIRAPRLFPTAVQGCPEALIEHESLKTPARLRRGNERVIRVSAGHESAHTSGPGRPGEHPPST